MNKTVLYTALALAAHGFANEMKEPQQAMPEQKMQMQQPKVVTLTSARPESDNGWYLFADAIYWHADVGSTDWVIKIDETTTPHTFDVHSLNFKWAWGFKAGVGVNIDHDKWDTNFYYTWFHIHNSNAASVPAIHEVENVSINESWTTGSIHWSIHYSMMDWELGRWGYLSRSLALRPHVGLKGGWINQNIKAHGLTPIQNPRETTIHMKNHFWGVGPSGGLNSLWVFGHAGAMNQHRFSLFGDVAGALMYGHFEVKHRNIHTGGVNITGALTKGLDRNLAVTMLQGMLGFSWDLEFNNNRNHFTFKVGYELQYWFRQNQLIRFPAELSAGAQRASDDLALQGVTGEFRFDF